MSSTRSIPRELPDLTPLHAVKPQAKPRLSSGSIELDRVLGGGFVAGSLVLLGGEPGVGKSTLLLQVACHLAKGHKVLYLSGEESLAQIKMRSDRLGLNASDLNLIAEVHVDVLAEIIARHRIDVLIVDSIQTMICPDVGSPAGSISQVRESTSKLVRLCKPANITTILVGHITKDGAIAGPKSLEHMVDGVFYLEGDAGKSIRLLRAQKNRFGTTGELAMFQMLATGLRQVDSPSKWLLRQRPLSTPGSAIVPSLKGTRPIMVEVQVLTSQTSFASPRRLAMGIDPNRLSLLLAVLEKKVGIQLMGLDVFVNIVGGILVKEPAIDLGVALATYSFLNGRPIPEHTAVFGELGLTGEVRSVPATRKRIKEALHLGFEKVITPKLEFEPPAGVTQVGHVSRAIEELF